ncbi:MAG: pyridoxamine 5'-phosphate oxidase family protein [Acidobacteriota bacterium]
MTHPALHPGEIEMQRRRGVLEAGSRVAAIIHPAMPPAAASFIAQQPFTIAAVLDQEQRPWAALWSGPPGFLEIRDERTLNVAESSFDALTREKMVPGQVGLLAIEPETRRRMRFNGMATEGADGLRIEAEEVFSNCPKFIQKRILAWHDEAPATPTRGLDLNADQRRQIAGADTLFLATHNPRGGADASHRGGPPGFVRWIDEKTLEFADYAGNNLFNTLGNLVLNPRLGLLHVDFESGDILQLTGHVELIDEVAETSSYPGSAGLRVRFEAEEWLEQRRAMPWRGSLVEPSPFNPLPEAGVSVPNR